MTPSKNCYDLIKRFEGLELSAYNDPGTNGLPITIGYGSTTKADGSPFHLGDKITQIDAENLLEWEVNSKAKIVLSLLKDAPVNQNQFDSVVSFSYNVGTGNFKNSTMLKKIKVNPNDTSIPLEFMKWNKANKKVMKGLTIRRQAEADLYKS